MQLRELDLSVNNVSDISELSYLTALQKLDLDANRIADISALSKLVKLQVLSVFGNQIMDIQYISNLVNLEISNISNNQIIDISAQRYIKQLRELFMQNNQVVHIESLAYFNLQYLDLSHNFIFDLQSIAYHKHIDGVDFCKSGIWNEQIYFYNTNTLYYIQYKYYHQKQIIHQVFHTLHFMIFVQQRQNKQLITYAQFNYDFVLLVLTKYRLVFKDYNF
ncbi:leucine-rich_repeat domain-containing protein [Hexamita inflata]|uniref:Leucine-rich repeat domain-containing protein n=1 Tax=Hexamita inflata TaxID=28002 RepID=A0AA86PZL1_9EUKA|nr:leucine-rich repeat domain-containing protein [Hexamita inflata]